VAARRLQPDPLWALLKRGAIDNDEVQAAWDIRAAFEIITLPVRLRIASLEKIDCSTAGDIDGPRARRLTRRYNDWVDEMTRQSLAVGPVIDIVVEGKSCRRVDRERVVRKGTACRLLKAALLSYCRIAGWR